MGNSNKIINSISFGGIGDSYIVLLKLIEQVRSKSKCFSHIHIESNESVPKLIEEYKTIIPIDCMPKYDEFKRPISGIVNFNGKCDVHYQRNYKKIYSKFKAFNTTWHGNYNFPKNDSGLKNPFIVEKDKFTKHYDIAIQVSGGANSNNKIWKFNPIQLAQMLRSKGKKVVLLGSDEKYERRDDPLNFVNKTNLNASIGHVLSSKLLVGFDGILSYVALSYRMPVLYYSSAAGLDDHYIHPLWEQYRTKLELGNLREVIQKGNLL